MIHKPLNQNIQKYYQQACDPNSRFRSWDHCYAFFRDHWGQLLNVEVAETAALHLGFYLASWGMYRGSGFLLDYTYKIHKPVIHALASSQDFLYLQQHDVGTCDSDINLVSEIMNLIDLIRDEYINKLDKKPTDTLVTKILLGTVGCLPARDTYFGNGFKNQQYVYGSLNRDFVKRILQFCINNRPQLLQLQPNITDLNGQPYPLMKLVDMHFWQIGYDIRNKS